MGGHEVKQFYILSPPLPSPPTARESGGAPWPVASPAGSGAEP